MKQCILLVGLITVACTGCQTTSPSTWNPFASSPKVQESKYPVPARMAVMWSPAVLNQSGSPPTRGFGGRVYFYDAKNNPIAVEGQLVVYAYHNDKPNPESQVPDRKFVFTPEQFTKHYTPTELGASYSIWVPWDPAGQPQAEISLVPIFTASSGALVMGQASRNLLPGPATPEQKSYVTNCTLPGPEFQPLKYAPPAPPPPPAFGVQQASFVNTGPAPQMPAVAPPSTAPPHTAPAPMGTPQFTESAGLSTMSINLPGTMSDRLAQATPQVSLMQRMAALRQEAMAKQAGYAPPTGAIGVQGVPSASPPTAHGPLTTAPATAQNLSLGGVPQPWFPGSPPPARSALPGPTGPNGPNSPPTVGPLPTPPFPAARPSGQPG
jgi:hypothetical protein